MAKILEKNVKIFSSFGREIIQSVHFGAETFFSWCGAVPDPKFFSLVRCGAGPKKIYLVRTGAHRKFGTQVGGLTVLRRDCIMTDDFNITACTR